MADIDEDMMPRGIAQDEDVDLSDETQDFRFLLAFSCVIAVSTVHVDVANI